MKKLLLAGAFLALAPAGAMAADESGAWKINGAFDAMGINYSITCTMAQGDAGALTGTCTAPQGETGDPIKATGTVSTDGTKVEIQYDTTYQGSPVHLDYKGDVQPDGSLKGTIDAGAAQGTFTASKALASSK